MFLKIRSQGQKLFRKEPDILPEAVDFMSRPYAYSINKARQILGYEPKVNLSQGLEKTLDWIKKNDIKKFMDMYKKRSC